MINNFQEIVLHKLELMEKQLNEIPEMKKQLSEIPEMKKQISEIPEMKKQLEELPEMKKELTRIANKVATIEERTTNIEKITTILEFEFHEKVSALFDGYEMHEEQKENQFQKINYLDKKVENHDIRNLNLEQKIS